MPRQTYAGVLLALATLMSDAAFGQKSAASSTAPAARVQHVVVRGTGDAMEVEIQTSGAAVAPNTQAITGPDRIVVDFPGALPAEDLRALKVNRGPLKGVRSGLFFDNPPITRIVLDLRQPQSYQISTRDHSVIVKLGAAQAGPTTAGVVSVEIQRSPVAPVARLQSAVVAAPVTSSDGHTVTPKLASVVANAVSDPAADSQAVAERPQPVKPAVNVTFEDGMLYIRADRATLAQVLFEVQRQTHAEIAIPAGAEQEEVFADLGPAASRDVLASLLNGSRYNFIFVGTEQRLEQVILTRRDSNPY